VAHIGPDAVATVGLTESLLTLIYTPAMGLSIGVTAVVARRIRRKERRGAAEAAVQESRLGLIVAVVIGVVARAGRPLLAVMGASPAVQTMGVTYARVMLAERRDRHALS